MSKKRKVSALNLSSDSGHSAVPPSSSPSSLPFDGGHLERFWDLASLNEKKRRVAARAVVDVLAQPVDSDLYQRQVEYTLKRLVRGLASPRDMARHGYCLALTELLCTYDTIEPTRVVDMMVSTMSVSSNMKGDESRDVFFGRVFGCMALIRCGRLEGNAAQRVAEMLAHAAAKKVFLGEICVELIGELAKQRGFKAFEAELLPEIGELLNDDSNVNSVCLVARLRTLFPNKRPQAAQCPTFWNTSALSDPKNLQTVAEALKNSTSNHPRVHSVWGHVLADLGGDDAPHLPALWNNIVEEGLLTSTHERRYLAFELFAQLAPKIAGREATVSADGGPTTMLGVLLSHRFVKCLANNLSSESNYLFKAAQKCAAAIRTVAEGDDRGDVRLDVVKNLVRSVRDFDRISGTRLVQDEVAMLSEESAQAYRSFLFSIFESAGEDTMSGTNKADVSESASDSDSDEDSPASATELTQQWAIGQIFMMGKVHRDKEQLQLSLLLFLLTHGFYSLPSELGAKSCKQLRGLLAKETGLLNAPKSLSGSARQLCRLRFYSLLQDYTSQVVKRSDTSEEGSGGVERRFQMAGTMESGELWAARAVRFGDAILSSSKDVKLLKPLAAQAKEAEDEAMVALAEIKQSKADVGKDVDKNAALYRRLSGFEYLLVSMRLQLLDAPEETTDILNDVVQCYRRSQGEGDDEAPEGGDAEGSADPVTVLVDCMLSLLTRPSALIREVVGTVFRAFTAEVGETALDLLLHALQVTTGDEEEDGDEIEDIDDLPEIGIESSDDDGDNDGDVEEEEAGDDDDDETNKGDEDEENEVEGSVGPAVIDSDEDMWDENDEDDDLDDAEMFRLGFNEKLGQILRLKKEQSKKTVEDKRRANAHWKLRVLDLIEIFIKKEPRSELLLLLPMPLLECIAAPSVFKEELTAAERCSGIVMKLARAKEVPQCKAGRSGAQLAETVEAGLQQLLGYLQSTSVPMKLAVASVGYLVRVRSGGDAGDRDAKVSKALVPIFTAAYLQSMQKRSCRLQPKFFGELAQRAGRWLPAAFLSSFVPATTEASIASSYLRAEAATLFQKLLALLSKEDLKAKPTAACLAPLTTVFLNALTSANDDARRAKQALSLGHATVAFAGKLPGTARKLKAVTALWGVDGSVRKTLSTIAKSYADEPSVGVQCTRMLASIKQVFDGEEADPSESAAQARAREKKRLKDERRAKRAAKAAAQEERRRKREEEGQAGGNGHANGDSKANKKKNSKKAKKVADKRKHEDEDDVPFAVDEGIVLDEDETNGSGDGPTDDDVENDPAYQEFLRQVAIEEKKVDSENAANAGRSKRAKGRK